MYKLSFHNGDKMPALGIGTWKSEKDEVKKAIKEAIKTGYRHIDCAAIYGNEKEIGEALSEIFEEGLVKREELWITSKLWNDSHQPDDVEPALKKTLKDLQLDYLDLYLMHWPVAQKKGTTMPESAQDLIALEKLPLSDTWKAMEKVLEKKLTKHIGVSNFSTEKLKDLMAKSDHTPEMNQIELHPYLQQPDMLDFCRGNHIHLTAYSPLGSGDRSEELKEENEPVLMEDETLKQIAEQKGCSVPQLLLAWGIDRHTAVIPKSTNPKHIKQNFEASKIELEEEEKEKIAQIDKDRRYVVGKFVLFDNGPYTYENLWDEEK